MTVIPGGVPPVCAERAGQDKVLGQAVGELSGGRTRAGLFTGAPGSGRSIAARAFAAALLCPNGGCDECPSCRQVRAGTHADLLLVRPDGLSYGVKQTRELVLRAAGAPSGGRWLVTLFEDADRCTEAAANALLKAIEEPAPRTVWLLCAPSAEDLVTTIRSRCRVMSLRVPPSSAVASVLVERDGISPEAALAAAQAAQGHVGRARRLAADPTAAARRLSVLAVPVRATSLGPALAAAASLVKTAEEEAKAVTEQLDEPEREALRQSFGEGSTGKGIAKAMRGMSGAMKDLEDRQKSRATRVKRDTLDGALMDLMAFYRDVLMVQFGADAELFNADRLDDLRHLASSLQHLDALERFNLLGDTWAAVVAGRSELDDLLVLTEALTAERDPDVWGQATGALGFLDHALDEDHVSLLADYTRALVGPVFAELGWAPAAGEGERVATLRAQLLATLGTVGRDTAVRAEAARRHDQALTGGAALLPDLASAVVEVAALVGTEADYERYLQRYRSPDTPQEEMRYLMALTAFSQPALAERTFELAATEVRSQNAPFVISMLLTHREHGAATWLRVAEHWERLVARTPVNILPRMLSGVRLLCRDAALAAEVRQFLAAHPLPSGQRTVDQAVERLGVNVRFAERLRATAGTALRAGLERLGAAPSGTPR